MNEYFGLPSRRPHWSAEPFRYLVQQLRAGEELPWYQRPVGLILVAVATAAVVKVLGLV